MLPALFRGAPLLLQYRPNVLGAAEYADNFDGARIGGVDHQVGIDREEPHGARGQVVPEVPGVRIRRKECEDLEEAVVDAQRGMLRLSSLDQLPQLGHDLRPIQQLAGFGLVESLLDVPAQRLQAGLEDQVFFP